jgi:hypothetical protein
MLSKIEMLVANMTKNICFIKISYFDGWVPPLSDTATGVSIY